MKTDLKGQTVKDRYRLQQLIGHGAMGEVWLAADNNLHGKHVAVKIITKQNNGAESIQRFIREIDAMSQVKSIHVVQVTDSGVLTIRRDSGIWATPEIRRPFLVMDYVRGGTLKDVKDHYGLFTIGQAARMLSDVLDGLAAMHRVGIIHRDVKPANVMYDTDYRCYRLTDFGLAKPTQPRTTGTLTQLGALMGTGDYMPPEAISQKTGPQGDLYSAGVMCWELIAGYNPIARPKDENDVTFALRRSRAHMPSLASRYAGVPQIFSDFVARLTAFDPARRPVNAVAAVKEFDRMTDALSATDLKWRAR